MNTVELRPAYQWTCDACGSEFYEPCLVQEIEPQDGMVLWAQFIPKNVTCPACKLTYNTIGFMDDEEEQ